MTDEEHEEITATGIDTTNDFAVGVLANELVVMRPCVGVVSRAQALRLAAYLVCLTEDCKQGPSFGEVLEAVRCT